MKNLITQTQPFFLSLQQRICKMIEKEDGQAKFLLDEWQREGNGGGKTMVLSHGKVFEQAGVNFSHVFGEQLPPSATAMRSDHAGCQFHAMGVSAVLHPHNPFVPTSHFNVRIFVGQKGNEPPFFWFGGGFDLTPYYGYKEDCIHWHKMAKAACDPFSRDYYPKFKAWCDDYFYLKHRKEARGIGGIFFDDFNELGFEKSFAFIESVGEHYLRAYRPIVNKRKNTAFSEKEKQFQQYRRGRYVEFNLLYDRGTLFGLQSGGRTESILMSLPPVANWRYNWQPEQNSAEAKLYRDYLPPQDWVNMSNV